MMMTISRYSYDMPGSCQLMTMVVGRSRMIDDDGTVRGSVGTVYLDDGRTMTDAVTVMTCYDGTVRSRSARVRSRSVDGTTGRSVR